MGLFFADRQGQISEMTGWVAASSPKMQNRRNAAPMASLRDIGAGPSTSPVASEMRPCLCLGDATLPSLGDATLPPTLPGCEAHSADQLPGELSY